jgi:hypothetical protein
VSRRFVFLRRSSGVGPLFPFAFRGVSSFSVLVRLRGAADWVLSILNAIRNLRSSVMTASVTTTFSSLSRFPIRSSDSTRRLSLRVWLFDQ